MSIRLRRFAAVLAVSATAATAATAAASLTTATPATAAAGCVSGSLTQPASPSPDQNLLIGVSTLSPCSTWVVGSWVDRGRRVERTLIGHWNGQQWTRLPSPNAGPATGHAGELDNRLLAVSAIGPGNVWAVGYFHQKTNQLFPRHTLIEHWNGTRWTRLPSPGIGPGVDSALTSVSATSASDVWAVGSRSSDQGDQPLMLHYDGTAWSRVRVPSVGQGVELSSVAAIGARDAWAVGSYYKPAVRGGPFTLTMHWNGARWAYVASPPSNGSGQLTSVTASSHGNVWAGGIENGSKGNRTLVLRWDGTRWVHPNSPQPGGPDGNPTLSALATTSPSNTWMVGYDFSGGQNKPFVAHWTRYGWVSVRTAMPRGALYGQLFAADATPGNMWAAGFFGTPTPTDKSYAVHH